MPRGDGPVEHGRHQRARLRDEGDVAGQRVDAGAKLAFRPMPGTAGRGSSARAMRSRYGRAASSICAARSRPTLASPSAKPAVRITAARVPRRPKLVDERCDRVGRRRDHGQVGHDRQRRHVLVGHDAVHGGGAWIDRHDRPFEAALREIAHQRRADRMRPVGCADHRHRFRAEHPVEIADRHCARFRPVRAALSANADDNSIHGRSCVLTLPTIRST